MKKGLAILVSILVLVGVVGCTTAGRLPGYTNTALRASISDMSDAQLLDAIDSNIKIANSALGTVIQLAALDYVIIYQNELIYRSNTKIQLALFGGK